MPLPRRDSRIGSIPITNPEDNVNLSDLNAPLKNLERLITRDAESFSSREERQAEFERRLDRTRHLITCLGDPQNSLDLIHIGGTSGKGSVAILCESMLLACGLDEARLYAGLAHGDDLLLVSIDHVLNQVRDLVERVGSHYTGTEHLLLALVYDPAGQVALHAYGVRLDLLEAYLQAK